MSDSFTVITNHVPRDVIDAYELSADERAEFGYHDWDAVERGEESPTFFRYRGELYDLGEFMRWDNLQSPEHAAGGPWDGYQSDTFFSGLLVRYVDEFERVVVARYFA